MTMRGYAPRVVIDCGANRGQWTDMASRIFPAARFHLVEPQRGCHDALARFSPPRFMLHSVAVTAPDVTAVQMTGGGGAEDGTGAFVPRDSTSSPAAPTYPATTLDALFAGTVAPTDRALLKLDIEGHELTALAGARALLASVECVFSEVRFFDVHHSGHPVFADLLIFLRERNFDLYEIAGLSGRHTDGRLRLGDVVFMRRDSTLLGDVGI
jgi:FkbM family methyltransferase